MKEQICLFPTLYLFPVTWESVRGKEEEWISLLPQKRREELQKIQNKQARIQSLSGEILIRRIIKALLGLDAFQWDRDRGARGKPFFSQIPFFHYNISHTEGLVVCAVAGFPMGVDAEGLGRDAPLEVMRRIMTPSERATILQLPKGKKQTRLFFELWTRKEAYVKWTGEGITGAMNTVEVVKPPFVDQISTFQCNRWIISVCCESKQIFEKKEVPLPLFLSGEWKP